MSKNAEVRPKRFLERFGGTRLQRRGGFEGPEYVPPLKQEQVPIILVDGVPVRPKIVPPDSAMEPLDSRPGSELPEAKES